MHLTTLEKRSTRGDLIEKIENQIDEINWEFEHTALLFESHRDFS